MIIKNFEINWSEFDDWKLNKESISKINKTPIKPTIIDINLTELIRSSLVKKCDNTKVNIGPIHISIPAVDDWINCSDQLMR